MCTEDKKVQAAVKVRVATHNYLLAKNKILSYCSRKSCSSSGPGKSGCPCPWDSPSKCPGDCSTAWKGSYHHILLQLFPKKCTLEGFFKERGHVQAYLLWSKSPRIQEPSGSPGYGIRQAQLVSGSWLGESLSVLGGSCGHVYQAECPGSSWWISTHRMESYSFLASRAISCLAPGCWASAFNWCP